MPDPLDILVDNLKETFKAIERFLLVGLTASLVLIVLAATDRELTGDQKLMFADLDAPSVLVALVALATYTASGAFAAFHFAARRRIVRRLLESDPAIVDALLTYPSVASRIGAPQIVALLTPGAMGMIALYAFYAPTHEIQKAVLGAAVMSSPYIALTAMAFLTAVQER